MKSFIITLTDNQISLNFANTAVESAKKFNTELIVWPAVNGLLDGLEKLNRYKISKILKKSLLSRPGVLGCFLSHYELWNYCLEINEVILILEHDALFIRHIPENIESCFEDILKLDPFKIQDKTYHTKVKDSLSTPIDYFYKKADGISKAGEYTLGAYCYCIKPAAAKKLIDFAINDGVLPTDLHIGRNVVDLKSTTVPIISLQETHSYLNIKHLSSTTDLENFGEK